MYIVATGKMNVRSFIIYRRRFQHVRTDKSGAKLTERVYVSTFVITNALFMLCMHLRTLTPLCNIYVFMSHLQRLQNYFFIINLYLIVPKTQCVFVNLRNTRSLACDNVLCYYKAQFGAFGWCPECQGNHILFLVNHVCFMSTKTNLPKRRFNLIIYLC